MILEVAILNLKPGTSAEYEVAFTQAAPLIASMPGYLGHNLRRCMETKDKYILLVGWETLDAHTVGFRGSAKYIQWKTLLHHFYDPFPTVEHYELPDGSAFASIAAPTPRITSIEPDILTVNAPDTAHRTLIVRGENFDYPDLDLQFLNVETGEMSIHFQGEIEWVSPTEVRVDIDRIQHLLWSQHETRLKVRFTNGSDFFKPMCDWSDEFRLLKSLEGVNPRKNRSS